MHSHRSWDVFCRVIDNHGDIGVAWRLCADLAERGEHLRLWVDDARALAWMAPQGHPGVECIDWCEPAPDLVPGEVVVETFGCKLPRRFVQRMAEREPPPAWINLEYLSAERYVERSHALASPVAGAPQLVKRFFFPGFTAGTGGLLREPGLLAARQAFDGPAWLRELGVDVQAGERLVSLFCYDNPALAGLLGLLQDAPALVLAAPGAAAAQLRALLGPGHKRGALRAIELPWLTQPGYDRLLWACDLNLVRGEDSFVRAQWAAKPFVWQAYPQQGGAQRDKVLAFLDRLLVGSGGAARLRALWLGWNALAPLPAALPAAAPWQRLCERWREGLLAQPDLVTQLIGFSRETR